MFSIATFIILFMCWVLFSGKFDLFHLALGFISCLIVAVISSDLLFNDRKKGFSERIIECFRFIGYSFWLLYQILLANLHVIGLAVSPTRMEESLDPHIFTFTTSLKTDFARFVLANSITLTPGTVTIRIDGDTFYVHAISHAAAGDLIDDDSMSEMERRIAYVFEGGAG